MKSVFDKAAVHELVIITYHFRTAASAHHETIPGNSTENQQPEKKPDSRESGLRYWPREADTITFQEGLLNTRATGGGGQMRDANAQRTGIMIRVSAVRQPFTPHVSHAGIAGLSSDN
jgi:hypothetical protein